MRIDWGGTDEDLIIGLDRYEQQVYVAIREVAKYFAPVLEAYAKEKAPWTDRTGHARQRLHTIVNALSQTVVELYLAHGVEYGIYLETKWAGRYGIVWETIEAHLGKITSMLNGIFGSGTVGITTSIG
jgi:hypothetical protein